MFGQNFHSLEGAVVEAKRIWWQQVCMHDQNTRMTVLRRLTVCGVLLGNL